MCDARACNLLRSLPQTVVKLAGYLNVIAGQRNFIDSVCPTLGGMVTAAQGMRKCKGFAVHAFLRSLKRFCARLFLSRSFARESNGSEAPKPASAVSAASAE